MKPYTQEVKGICQSLLDRIQTPFQIRSIDPPFKADCFHAARDRSVPLDGCYNIEPYLNAGIAIAALAYAHLDYEPRMYVALYTGIAIAVDDACKNDIDLLRNFTDRFHRGVVHGHPIMDSYDSIVREMVVPGRFDPFTSGTILQAALDYIIGMVFEYEIQDNLDSPKPPKEFATFVRDLTGIGRMYAVLMFPRGLPLRSWMEVIPATMRYIHIVNDIFSFYKEELAGECMNFISVEARSSGQSKLDILRCLTDEAVELHNEALAILWQCPDALEAYRQFSKGYVYFHTSCKRYKVSELWVKGSAEDKMLPKSHPRSSWIDVLPGLRLLFGLIVTFAIQWWLGLSRILS